MTETKTESLWELREESLNGQTSLLITTGARESVEWLGSITVPRDGYRIVMRPAKGEE